MYTNHRHYVLLISAVLAFAASIYGYMTMWNSINSQAADSSRVAAEVSAATEQKQHQQDLASVYAQSAATRASVKTFIVSQEKIVDFLNIFEDIGATTKAPIDVSAIDTTGFDPSSPNAIGHFTAHLASSGSWSAVMRSLILIENMPYSISLNNIHIDREDGKKGVWDLALDITALTTN